MILFHNLFRFCFCLLTWHFSLLHNLFYIVNIYQSSYQNYSGFIIYLGVSYFAVMMLLIQQLNDCYGFMPQSYHLFFNIQNILTKKIFFQSDEL